MTWIDAWNASARDPALFVRGVLGAEPMPWQEEALGLFVDHDRLAIRSAHDQGKTALIAWVVWWFMCTRRNYKIPITANSQDQLRDVTWAEIAKWGRRLPPELRDQFDIGLERISLRADPENNFAVPRTASKDRPEAMQGFHAPHLLFIIEEASGIEDIVFEVAQGAMSSVGAKALMVANPTRATGFFHRAFTSSRSRWKGLHWPWRKAPWNDERYPTSMAEEYGEHSNVYRVRVLGEFPTSDDAAVIPLQMVEAAIGRDVLPNLRSIVWGVDVARYGDDRSALCKRKGNVITERVKVWRNRDTMQTVGIVYKEWMETPSDKRPAALNVDVIGIGAGVVDRLRELGLPAFGVNVGERAEDDARFPRLRDELWWRAREWFNSRDCSILDDAALVADLVAPTYKVLSNAKLQVEPKDEMKKRGLHSPDLADAFCLTFAGGEYSPAAMRQTHAYDDYNPLDLDKAHRRGEQVQAENEYSF